MSIKIFIIIASLFFIQSCHSQLKLHGGPVMNFPISLHFLYYGPWGTSDEEYVILNFVGANIASTAWYAITECLEDFDGNPVTNHVDLPTKFIQKNTKKIGNNIINTKDDIETVIKALVAASNILFDPNDIYVLITHDDVQTDLACNDACGYHSYFNNSDSTPIKYMLVASGGLINSCDACDLNVNGPWGGLTNQLVNTFAHQLINTVSDPVPFTGWYDPDVKEAATKCTQNFVGAIPFNPDKSKNWNVVIASSTEKHWFLLQGNWDITANACRLWPQSDCSVIAPPTPLFSTAHNPSSGMMLKAGFSVFVSALFSVFCLF